jgi:hypothetical protein
MWINAAIRVHPSPVQNRPLGLATSRVFALRRGYVIIATRKTEAASKARNRIAEENPTARADVLKLDLDASCMSGHLADQFNSMNLPLKILMQPLLLSWSLLILFFFREYTKFMLYLYRRQKFSYMYVAWVTVKFPFTKSRWAKSFSSTETIHVWCCVFSNFMKMGSAVCHQSSRFCP